MLIQRSMQRADSFGSRCRSSNVSYIFRAPRPDRWWLSPGVRQSSSTNASPSLLSWQACGGRISFSMRAALAAARPICFVTAGCASYRPKLSPPQDSVGRVPNGRGFHVSKRDLISQLIASFNSECLRIDKTLPEASELTNELQNFQSRQNVVTGSIAYLPRGGEHDDLVYPWRLASGS